jgi:D-3-phosphoglycerate dehydrogenase
MPKVSRVLVTDAIQQVGLEVLTQRDDVVIDLCQNRTSEEDLIDRVPNVDAILVGTTPITERIIEAARVLKVVSRRGVGYDNIDLAAPTQDSAHNRWFGQCYYGGGAYALFHTRPC